MILLAIDPGSEKSALVLYDTERATPRDAKIVPNRAVIGHIISLYTDALAIEMIASYGMAVGKTVFETCVWIGRFDQAYRMASSKDADLIYRLQVKQTICHDSRAKDSNIRRALIDRFPATGGGKTPQVGTKGQPGPLYGFKADMWAALGVAVTWAEQHSDITLATAAALLAEQET